MHEGMAKVTDASVLGGMCYQWALGPGQKAAPCAWSTGYWSPGIATKSDSSYCYHLQLFSIAAYVVIMTGTTPLSNNNICTLSPPVY